MSSRPLLHHLRRMVHVGPYGGELPVALRAAASVAVPMLVLWATGHLEWSLYATFGAFTSLFGRTAPVRPRLVSQVQAGGVLVASVLVGTLLAVLGSAVPGTGWLVVPVAALWATGVAILSHRLRWHPPGPLFPVFALGACSSVPAGPEQLPVALAAAPPPLVVIAVAALLQAGAELYVGRNYALAMLFITPLALSMTHLAHPVPVSGLVSDRALDTVVGVAVAVVITLLTHECRQDAEG